MFSKPEEAPKVYLVTTEDGDSAGIFLSEESADLFAAELNEEHAPEFAPYFVICFEVTASEAEWAKVCPACKAGAQATKRTEDDLK